MHYIAYLLGVSLLSAFSILYTNGVFSVANLLYCLDYITLGLMAVACLLALVGTKSCKAFGRAFAFVVGRMELSNLQCKESLLAVKAVMRVAGFFGIVLGFAQLVHLSSPFGDPLSMEATLVLAALPIFYAALVALALLPVQIALQKQIRWK